MRTVSEHLIHGAGSDTSCFPSVEVLGRGGGGGGGGGSSSSSSR